MHRPKRKIDKVFIQSVNSRHKQHINTLRVRLSKFDENKITKESDVCNYCMYITPERIGGASMTHTECGICETPLTFNNTCVDILCTDCAVLNKLCKHCGGDIEMKDRRTQRHYETNIE